MKKTIVVSPKWELIGKDFQSLAIGLGIALAGSALTYLSEYLSKANFGEWTPVVVALWSVVANTIRKFITDKQYIK